MTEATLTFHVSQAGTIIQQDVTSGMTISPNLPSGLRIIMLVSEDDFRNVMGIGEKTITVTDLVTGFEHRLRRASCGLGCRCAVEFC